MNRHRPHVLLIPEDDANRQLANGFTLHHAVAARAVGVLGPAGGRGHVLPVFAKEYVGSLRAWQHAHVVLLIDFDNVEDRRARCEEATPADVRPRVFPVGSRDEPEAVKRDVPGVS